MAAGAVLAGKTNMDQFATGLVGTRTPYGACSSVFDDRYISGGSSSGSAVAVAKGLVDFALGTDTAGSGRVPAAFNNLIGLKPTRGLISTAGVVPACRTLDCVSVFARDCCDALSGLPAARGADAKDPYSASCRPARAPRRGWGMHSASEYRLHRSCSSSATTKRPPSTADAIRKLESLGHAKVEIDFSCFRERPRVYCMQDRGLRNARRNPELYRRACRGHGPGRPQHHLRRVEVHGRRRVSRGVPASGTAKEQRKRSGPSWTFCSCRQQGRSTLMTQIASDPVGLNTNLGYYTNFVNLMDLAAVAAPAGFRSNGLPFGVSFIGPAFTDEALLRVAERFTGQNNDRGAQDGQDASRSQCLEHISKVCR